MRKLTRGFRLAFGSVLMSACVFACSGWDPSKPFEREAPQVNEAIELYDGGDAGSAEKVLEAYLLTGHCSEGNIGTPDRLNEKPNGTFDFGLQLPWGHSSIWLRNAGGIARGEADDPYANFFLGGFGNNYVDSRTEKRYREHYSFPGFELNEIAGLRYSRHMLEANFPPAVFESVGTPALHLTWLRPAVFASVLYTDSEGASSRRYGNVGAQVDFNFSVLHWYQMTLSFGYATGYRGSKRAGDEWMVSLKVM